MKGYLHHDWSPLYLTHTHTHIYIHIYIRKILTNNTKIIYKNNNKNRLIILEAISIKIKITYYKKIAQVLEYKTYSITNPTTPPNWMIQLYIIKKHIPNKYKNLQQLTATNNSSKRPAKWSKALGLEWGTFFTILTQTLGKW